MKHVDIFTDGSSRGNPGPGGYGAILRFEDPSGNRVERELSQGYALTTNNRMELLGVIVSLESLNQPCDVTIITDSKYVSDAFNQNWIEGWISRGWKNSKKEPVANVDLWKRLISLSEEHDLTFKWIKGHAGYPENERCDRLATQAADGDDLMVDHGYESLNL